MSLTFWANMAMILLIIEAIVLAIPWLILFYLALRGVRALKDRLRGEWFPLAHQYTDQAWDVTHQVSATTTGIPMQIMSAKAGAQAAVRALAGQDGTPS